MRARGTTSNRDGIGARVELTIGNTTRWQLIKTGSSYLSQSEVTVTFGLGNQTRIETLRILWPSGEIDTLNMLDANQLITVEEGTGLVDASPITGRD